MPMRIEKLYLPPLLSISLIFSFMLSPLSL
nr:MAG TPA: hypothetical protein [Bacteriophage sp.]